MSFNRVLTASLLIGAAGLAGCHSASKALGMTKVSPDEFRIVTKAPLTLPPDYALRPPAPGQPRPQELQPESAARVAIEGQRQAEVRSDGEKLLVTKAGGDKADPLIRYVIDDDFGAIAHKDKSFADWVMFWRPGKPASEAVTAAADANTATPVDPDAEAKRIKGLTGDQPITIAQKAKKKGKNEGKLPGL